MKTIVVVLCIITFDFWPTQADIKPGSKVSFKAVNVEQPTGNVSEDSWMTLDSKL